ncbi:DUF4350 domain-containing protein [Mycolicibacterium poriferae]|uniref:Membrane protein n=1 Tax=Mycolicibacterium poriferae TaxID=39694 RepID=A0A6N4V0J4_9MYCO|nr:MULTISPECIES: DUF4350 domain-containing protein [Mycolicibacterium]MCG7581433.1 DUF4350 domain-containing protein [Mycolicibacterium sp. OfavD-34-C]MCV7261869.1 DUF4350 domain-containing protein [Mycolicibacterium poriferae]BBX49062.1 membrane protein [Mycolicibacterium poriferae]
MTPTSTAVGPTMTARWRGVRWVLVAVVVIVAVAVAGAYLSGPRSGGPMDPDSTAEDGAHALVALLRDRGVTVVEAADLASVERAARPDTLLIVAQTPDLHGEELLGRLAALPGDRLLVQPSGATREALAPRLDAGEPTDFGGLRPDCDLREATRAGAVRFDGADTFDAAGAVPVTRCYDGALARYTVGERTVTAVGSAHVMANGGLLQEGNAALAMNLAGTRQRAIWYAPQFAQFDDFGGDATLSDLVPEQVGWLVFQLVLVVALLALWKIRRVGPLVAEQLPVVVRASETVEGRGRMYRAHRARDRSAEALRTATLHRMLPRLGLGPAASPDSVAHAVHQRCGLDPHHVARTLYGPPPVTDDELVGLAGALDDIERQVARS